MAERSGSSLLRLILPGTHLEFGDKMPLQFSIAATAP